MEGFYWMTETISRVNRVLMTECVALRLAQQRYTVKDISRMYGVSPDFVYRVAYAAGIPTTRRHEKCSAKR
jgi:hypothetical protein